MWIHRTEKASKQCLRIAEHYKSRSDKTTVPVQEKSVQGAPWTYRKTPRTQTNSCPGPRSLGMQVQAMWQTTAKSNLWFTNLNLVYDRSLASWNQHPTQSVRLRLKNTTIFYIFFSALSQISDILQKQSMRADTATKNCEFQKYVRDGDWHSEDSPLI